jgi:oligoribonuclease NrnB/cAMP/cGMP phosphodiesterase (DHH superfamily)
MIANNIFVLYHANCFDGTGAKYAAWVKFEDTANYIAVNYGQEPPKELDADSEVYILDFSYPRNVLEALQERCRSVVVLDHHKTAKEALEGLKGCYFDMNRSGAVMAWEYFHPGVPLPKLLKHIQDRDLWNWDYDETKAITTALPLIGNAMGVWKNYIESDDAMRKLTDDGKVILARDELSLASKLKHVKVISFLGYKVGVVNSTELISEIGNTIYDDVDLDVDFAMVYSITKENEVLASFRSKGHMDVAEIAAKFGGGGHKNASGAKLRLGQLVRILEEEMK